MSINNNLLKQDLKTKMSQPHIRAHFPAHQGKMLRANTSYELDVPYIRKPLLHKAEERIAHVFGAANSWLLTQGASQGLLASIICAGMSTSRFGLAHNSHIAVIHGAILTDLELCYIPSKCAMPTTEEVMTFLDKNPPPVLILTAPNYRGEYIDLCRISHKCRSKNIKLIVDEVHGSHLALESNKYRMAMSQACDLVIHSPHKYVGALVQGALLHRPPSSAFSREQIDKALSLVNTTSCSNLIRISLEESIYHMVQTNTLTMRNNALKRIVSVGDIIDQWASDALYRETDLFDPWKLILKSDRVSGYELARRLLSMGLDHEFANEDEVLFVFSEANDETDMLRVKTMINDVYVSLRELPQPTYVVSPKIPMRIPDFGMKPRTAFFSRKQTMVSVTEALGAIACKPLAFEPPLISDKEGNDLKPSKIPQMPPGSPVIVPGERISEWHIECLDAQQLISVCDE
ncbi:hypothetical protein AB835_11415 [Candidatus Endobugula sertula]|uniref:Orn/Lys/Arg decarboxylases family 1 pyridoxal-P attachment site domain-containing protein n=1 Tax=Candidatus Endobugula sertula TaxID=62101 RepID=A0A1D2QN16_9GAMM|nr:hypothetical protein AB835_11415 [Candidatus Endobugula sertula]